MSTIALIGPDGAGKSTILDEIESQIGMPVKRVYMGIRFESSNILLPTTRLLLFFRRVRGGGPNGAAYDGSERNENRSFGLVSRVLRKARSTFLLLNLIAETWYRQAVAWSYQRQGYLVLFDRHFIADYHAFNYADPRLARYAGTRLQGFLLQRYYPRPDFVICLDAPADVLVARKPELPVERIALLREGYRKSSQQFSRFVFVDVTQPKGDVVAEVCTLIRKFVNDKP